MEQQDQQPIQQGQPYPSSIKKSFVSKKWLCIFAIIGVLIVVFAVYFLVQLSQRKIPLIQLRHQGTIYEGQKGSGCWPTVDSLGSTLCWDTVFPDPDDVIPVLYGDSLYVLAHAYERPQQLSAIIFTADDKQHVKTLTLNPSEEPQFQIDLSPGIYILTASGKWSIGDVSYGFKVKVEGAVTSTLQTYRNEEYGFEIQYPKDFVEAVRNDSLFTAIWEDANYKFSVKTISPSGSFAQYIDEVNQNRERRGEIKFVEQGSGHTIHAGGYPVFQQQILLGPQELFTIETFVNATFRDKIIVIQSTGKDQRYDPNLWDVPILSTFRFYSPSFTNEMATLYEDESLGFQIEYPRGLLKLQKDDKGVSLGHSIPFQHGNPCDFRGGSPLLEVVTDFNMSIEVVPQSFEDITKSSITFQGFVENGELQLAPGYIDPIKIGEAKGYKITQGAEGCGVYTYYLPVSEKTFIIERPWGLTARYHPASEIFQLDNLIPPAEAESIFDQILSTFRFIP